MNDWLPEVQGKLPHRPKRRWWAVAARPMPQMPLDVVTTPGVVAMGAYGLRQLRARYVGPAVNVQRSSDSATMDIGFRGPNFDAQTFSTFVGGGTGTVNIWYDQSVNGNNLTATTSPPTINLTGLNGLPAALFVDATVVNHVLAPVVAQPYTLNAVVERTSNFSAYNGFMGDDSSVTAFYFNLAPNGLVLYGGTNITAPVACSDSVAHSLAALFNGASSTISVDGGGAITTNVTPGAASLTGLRLGHFNGGLSGFLSEAIFWSGQVDPGSLAALLANQKAYWLTP